MNPQMISIEDYNYHLPDDRVAKYPLAERDQSKLLVYENREITASSYKDIDSFLPEGSLLVFNNTKVVEARLMFQKTTGASIEIFCLEPGDEYADITTAMLHKKSVRWKCLVGGANKWKHGISLTKLLHYKDEQIMLEARIAERLSDCFVIEMKWDNAEVTFAEILHVAGHIPLPPYLHREAEESDKNRYQTIYAKHDGSVAAPTAGLHFTEAVFKKLLEKNITTSYVTLHVGAGTFKPVKAATLAGHDMHTEFIDVSSEAIDELIAHADKTIVAVGTTSLRTIESLYWMGVKTFLNATISFEELPILQWQVYEITQQVSAKDALTALRKWMQVQGLTRLVTKTQILIAPGYELRIANAIVTNFHQPQSTLLLLIAAFIGDKWKDIYQYALDQDFRF